MVKYLRLFRQFVYLSRIRSSQHGIFYHSLDLRGREVDREKFLCDLSAGKRVAHFGFLDVPFTVQRVQGGRLLHQKLQRVAAFLWGVDIDPVALEQYRSLTGDTDNSLVDLLNVAEDAAEQMPGEFDYILLPEVLEHLPNPFIALQNLLQLCRRKDAALCVTVPNAYSVMGFHTALSGNELVHPDHYYYFSPVTLRHLLEDVGFTSVDLWLYKVPPIKNTPGITQHGLIALCRS